MANTFPELSTANPCISAEDVPVPRVLEVHRKVPAESSLVTNASVDPPACNVVDPNVADPENAPETTTPLLESTAIAR
ncbi:hypothetical protein OFC05_28705, partial [Escherichia coli]|nr:hypothetical protein [Escherichia coli]